ncbi:MAG: aromatic ring-hydroxylating dioxygenase subunit alpha, partial [Planctomycetota bacterium]
ILLSCLKIGVSESVNLMNPRLLQQSTSLSATIDLVAEADWNRCGALKDFWYVACLACELSGKKPLPRTILGFPLVLFRDENQKSVALKDRCLHRNAALSKGIVLDGKIGCPYHGWMYNAKGQCTRIPSLGPSQRGEGFSKKEYEENGLKCSPQEVGCLPHFDTLEQDGLIYVYLGKDSKEARCPPFRVPHYQETGWCSYFMVTRFSNGVTNLVENFMDVPHTVFVHRGWFRRESQKSVPAVVERQNGSVLVTYEQGQDQITGLGRILNPFGEAMKHTDRFYVPNVTRVDYTFGSRSAFIINSQATPIGPLESLVYTAISYRLPLDFPRGLLARILKPLMHWYTRQVIEQDVAIMLVQRQGLINAPEGGQFISTEADLIHTDIEAYRSWLREGGQGNGPTSEKRRIFFWI